MAPGALLYKCRLCDEVHRDVHVPDTLMAIVGILSGEGVPRVWGGILPQLLNIHSCADGQLGVADLIGTVEDA